MQITVRNYPCRANSGCGPIVRRPGVNITPLWGIRHSPETVLDIDMKLSVAYGTTI